MYIGHPQGRYKGFFFNDAEVKHFRAAIEDTVPITEADDSMSTLTYLKRSSDRRIANEDQLLSFLRTWHPNVITVEFTNQTSFEEQVHVLRRTEILVAVHGAGLANMLFMQPGRTVIEIMPYMWYKEVYLYVANRFGLLLVQWQAKQVGQYTDEEQQRKCSELLQKVIDPQVCWWRSHLFDLRHCTLIPFIHPFHISTHLW